MSGELTVNVRDNIAGANATQIINIVIRQPTASIQACLRALDCPDAGAIKTEIHSADGVILECIEWIFQDDRFLKWKEPGENSVLWINGSPGKGKTRMATGIVDSLLKETGNSTVNGIAKFSFCQSTDDRLNNAVGVLKGIIRSLIEQRPLTVEHLHRHWIDEEQKFDMDFNQIAPLWTVLKRMVNDHGHLVTHVVIDAIDEYNHHTEELLRLIFTDGLAFPRSIKWLLTSRPLNLRLQEIIYGSSERIEVDLDGSSGQVEDAVKRYIKAKTRWMNNNRFSTDDQAHISELLFTKSESTFLWIAFVCQEVRNLPAAEVIEVVSAMPKGLRNLYQRSMQLLDEACHVSNEFVVDHRKLIWTLQSLSSSPHMLELAMLAGISTEKAKDESYLLQVIRECNTFLVLTNTDVVKLVHKSVRDYLVEMQTMVSSSVKLPSHETIARRCQQALEMSLRKNVANLRATDSSAKEANQDLLNVLLHKVGYSCVHLFEHAQKAGLLYISSALQVFLQRYLLHWLEVMSVLGFYNSFIAALTDLESSLKNSKHRLMDSSGIVPREPWSDELGSMSHFVSEAKNFALVNGHMISGWPLQVYTSALIFSPVNDSLMKALEVERPAWALDRMMPRSNIWNPAPSETIEHGQAIETRVSLSKDGEKVITASPSSSKIWELDGSSSFEELYVTQKHSISESSSFDVGQAGVFWKDSLGPSSWVFNRHEWNCDSGKDPSVEEAVHVSLRPGHSSNYYYVSFMEHNRHLFEIELCLRDVNKFAHSICFSSDYELFAAFDIHSGFRIWSMITHQELPSIATKGFVDGLGDATNPCMKFSEDSSTLVCEVLKIDEQLLIVCNIEDVSLNVRSTRLVRARNARRLSWAISHDGKYLACSTGNEISILDTFTNDVFQTIKGSGMLRITLSTRPLKVAAAVSDGTVRIWDLVVPSNARKALSHRSVGYESSFPNFGVSGRSITAWSPSPNNQVALLLPPDIREAFTGYVEFRSIHAGRFIVDMHSLGPWDEGTVLAYAFSSISSLFAICYVVNDTTKLKNPDSCLPCGLYVAIYEVPSFDFSPGSGYNYNFPIDTRSQFLEMPHSVVMVFSRNRSSLLCSYLVGQDPGIAVLDVDRHSHLGHLGSLSGGSSWPEGMGPVRTSSPQAICISADKRLIATSSLLVLPGMEVCFVEIYKDYQHHARIIRFDQQGVRMLEFSPSAGMIAVVTGQGQIAVYRLPKTSASSTHVEPLELFAESGGHGQVRTLEFVDDCKALKTDFRVFPISKKSQLYQRQAYTRTGLHFDGQWICAAECRILFVPPEYRPYPDEPPAYNRPNDSLIIQGSCVWIRTLRHEVIGIQFDLELIEKTLQAGELL
ncbi:hypothetical protein D6D21_05629 [Aureobasidium pullulans]|uniref:Nephrocystin 3-like N-terminal domain-containing protein n=1 Tax=Aureobasidium pullulans TaxID=5580 RepID=A0AB74IXQ9_AURPU|nr:hypothetical protein D6D21_05629 [Aureobasidium pullulans]